jgi:TPR repeat protein
MSSSDKARAARLHQARQYSDALVHYLPLAERGDTQSQLIVASFYEEGLGTGRNLDQAIRWYVIAAKGGSPEAQHHLGHIYYEKNDYGLALYWYKEAARRRYLPAIWRLGWFYEMGRGVPHDRAKAYEMFERAAQQGHIFAERDLARLLLKGHRGMFGVFRGLYLFVRTVIDAIRVGTESGTNTKAKI